MQIIFVNHCNVIIPVNQFAVCNEQVYEAILGRTFD